MEEKKSFGIMKMALVAMFVVTALSVGASGGSESAATDTEGPFELSIISRRMGSGYEDSIVRQELEKRLNLSFDWVIKPTPEYWTTTQIVLASGDYPDMMETDFRNEWPRVIKELAEDEIILPLNDLLDQYGPNIKAARPHPNDWYRPLPDGEAYAIQTRGNPYKKEHGFLARVDWLENLGLSMPTSLDELYNVARAFTFDDPDQDGKQDTFGVDGGYLGSGRGRLSFLLYATAVHGVMQNHWNEVDGKLVWWAVHPGTLEALKYMRRLYQDGLMDPEFPILDRDDWRERVELDQYGLQFWALTQVDEHWTQWWPGVVRNLPHAEFDWIPIFEDQQSRQRYPGTGHKYRSRRNIVLFSQLAHPNKAIELVDYLASPEGASLAEFGLPGVHYKEEEGRILPLAPILDEEQRKQAGTYLYMWFFRPSVVTVSNPFVQEGLDLYASHVVDPIIEEVTPAQTEYARALEDFRVSTFMEIQTGTNIDVDAVWDRFLRDWHAKGGQEWTDEMTEAWQMMQ